MEAGTKKEIRKHMLAQRDAMVPKERHEKSVRICERIQAHPLFLSAKHILCYVNYRSETETLGLIAEALRLGKWVYCPLVDGTEMDFYRISGIEELHAGFHGILEPPMLRRMRYVPQPGSAEQTLMIMPGAAFDRSCHRIGYGGGYYDRYLQKAGNPPKIAAAFSIQVADAVPYEAHDICPDAVVTETEIIVREPL
ncbi:MAG: 5-formyltetrahydrofolate cyclo-ligase [Lachnospiraceae bacterium]|nr:5-formyltetrahydrofolate cyclo-ligase [Lachnospiraceae bacterium]